MVLVDWNNTRRDPSYESWKESGVDLEGD